MRAVGSDDGNVAPDPSPTAAQQSVPASASDAGPGSPGRAFRSPPITKLPTIPRSCPIELVDVACPLRPAQAEMNGMHGAALVDVGDQRTSRVQGEPSLEPDERCGRSQPVGLRRTTTGVLDPPRGNARGSARTTSPGPRRAPGAARAVRIPGAAGRRSPRIPHDLARRVPRPHGGPSHVPGRDAEDAGRSRGHDLGARLAAEHRGRVVEIADHARASRPPRGSRSPPGPSAPSSPHRTRPASADRPPRRRSSGRSRPGRACRIRAGPSPRP